ncbi:MAG: carbohydrate kinase family protein [bacterium]
MAPRKRVGVIGTFVWDIIHGRDVRSAPVEEWGGITYTLSGLDAALPDDWEIVPILKVGYDLAERAREYLRSLKRIAPDAALIEVPYPSHRVELHYIDDERRTEILTGEIPAWSWLGLKSLIDASRLDALYVNFLSGWELDLETAQLLRQHFHGPIHCDLHMKVMAVQSNGLRTPRAIPNVAEWCACFDFLQMNEEEMATIAPDSMSLAATALASGVSCLLVTLGKRGAVYVAAPGFDTICDLPPRGGLSTGPRGGTGALGALRTALVPAEIVNDPGDPTGCGDVWGATYFSRMVAGDKLSDAMIAAARAAARNVGHRGASRLAAHLRGEISLT